MALKQLSLEEAIDRFVPDGASVAIGMALESLIRSPPGTSWSASDAIWSLSVRFPTCSSTS
jgi:hypothetical protein